ncbi:MAG: toll/interleukin-1 receptor domain-containing protein [Candidatus Poribacteria bacterium]|nr:toll/interleukin-1 receptor domain-containing protein [Candidatus Poribacteria bacterium]
MKEKKKVFISCVEEDRPFIEVLHRDLENYGFETFWYAEDSPAGVSFKNHTEKEIDNCDHFLACFSEASRKKEQSDMRRELTLACEKHKTLQPDNNWLICLKINDCEIENYKVGNQIPLSELTYISFAENYNDGFDKLISSIIEHDSVEEYTGMRFKNKISSAKTIPAHNFSLDHANSIITEISAESAKSFQKLASLAVFILGRGKFTIEEAPEIRICDFIGKSSVLISGSKFSGLQKYGISQRELMLLEEERLINLSMVDPVYETQIARYQKRYIMDNKDSSRRFEFSGFPLTNRGRTLCILLSKTSQLSFNQSYYNAILEFYLRGI